MQHGKVIVLNYDEKVKLINIGKKIKNLRESKNLTLEQVGDYLGVNKATVQRYEIGEIDIRRTTAIKLAELFSVNPAYIMGWDAYNTDIDTNPNDKRAEFNELMSANNGIYFRLAKGAREMDLDLNDDDINFMLEFMKRGKK